MAAVWRPGLEGVVAARTGLTDIDGAAGRLYVRGYPVEELAPAASFEEVVHLLLEGERPGGPDGERLRAALAAGRRLPAAVLDALRGAVAAAMPPIEALRLGIDALPLPDPPDGTPLALVAATPAIAAAYWRGLRGLAPVEPCPDLAHAAGFLHLLHGRRPSPAEARCLETYLNAMVDHGLNASTFAARVIVSTRSDLKSAVVGALGALKGPLHGGAPRPALELLQEIGTPDRAELVLRAHLDRGDRLMGFGHREYRVRDPRAGVLADAVSRLAADRGGSRLLDLALRVEAVGSRLLDEAKPGRGLRANAELYTAVLLSELGIPSDLFTTVFAVSRVAGWVAHGLEQQAVDRLVRPASQYVGPPPRVWRAAAG